MRSWKGDTGRGGSRRWGLEGRWRHYEDEQKGKKVVRLYVTFGMEVEGLGGGM